MIRSETRVSEARQPARRSFLASSATVAAAFVAACAAFVAALSGAARADSVWNLVDAMNQARRDHGFAPLRVSDTLMRSSGTHARDMATRNYFSHWTPEGWDASLRIRGWGYSGNAGLAENIAAGYGDAWAVVRQWLSSPGHRANLLDPSYQAVGAGHYYQAGSSHSHYWVGHYGTE